MRALPFATLVLAPTLLATSAGAQTFDTNATTGALVGPTVSLAVFDLENDGDPDVAAYTVGSFQVFQNVGAGSFVPGAVLKSFMGGPGLVRTGDIDGDGLEDVLIAAGTMIEWYRNLGGGSFGPAKNVTNWASSVSHLELVDLNGDGFLDVLAGIRSPTRVVWFEHNQAFGPTGPIKEIVNYAAPSGQKTIRSLTSVDADQDGDPDVIFSTIQTGNPLPSIWLYLNGGDETFTQRSGAFTGALTEYNDALAAADLDGDGDVDLVTCKQSGGPAPLIRWLNDGTEQFTPQAPSNGATYENPYEYAGKQLEFVDLTQDGRLDLLVRRDDSMTWQAGRAPGASSPLGPGHRIFSAAMLIGTPRFHDMATADVDGDGDLDLLFATDLGFHWVASRLTEDCNGNGIPDNMDVISGASPDCNANFLPDDCELLFEDNDVDGDGQHDDCVLPALTSRVSAHAGPSGPSGFLMDDHDLPLDPAFNARQTFTLRSPFPQDHYFLLGSLSGTSPGIFVGAGTLPLNFDHYFNQLWKTSNSFALINHENKFNGPFGASNAGYALASIDLGKLPTMPNLVGLTAHHAFVAYDPLTLQIDFVSNAVPTRIVP